MTIKIRKRIMSTRRSARRTDFVAVDPALNLHPNRNLLPTLNRHLNLNLLLDPHPLPSDAC